MIAMDQDNKARWRSCGRLGGVMVRRTLAIGVLAVLAIGGFTYAASMTSRVVFGDGLGSSESESSLQWPLRVEYRDVTVDVASHRELIVHRRFEAKSWDQWTDVVLNVSGAKEIADASPMLQPGARQTFSADEMRSGV